MAANKLHATFWHIKLQLASDPGADSGWLLMPHNEADNGQQLECRTGTRPKLAAAVEDVQGVHPALARPARPRSTFRWRTLNVAASVWQGQTGKQTAS